MSSIDAEKKQSRVRLNTLREIELQIQNSWEEKALYDVDPKPGREKFFVTFPFPYMNGTLHLGHLFSLSKAEFAVRYQRMLGKQAVFPFGLHVTGMPIAGAARKLQLELAEGACPKSPTHTTAPDSTSTKEDTAAQAMSGHFHNKKTKLHAAGKPQREILSLMGIPAEDIPKFADPAHWLTVFPNLGLSTLKRVGVAFDRRRCFITTEANPFYDRFIRWQFNILRKANHLAFGHRFTIFSPETGQPCQDHDREVGEGAKPQEYTLVKLRAVNYKDCAALAAKEAVIKDATIVLPCATLRPETMFGQTNCWVSPTGVYGAYHLSEKEILITSPRSAHNLGWQGHVWPESAGKAKDLPDPLFTVTGREILGLAVTAPNCPFKQIYVLPMETVILTKGTGVVTSVPSDSPDDFINYTTLRKKPDWAEKEYGIGRHTFETYDIVPIISYSPATEGAERTIECFAETICARMKITGPKDKEKLEEAKKECYLRGFSEGHMVCPQAPEFHGKPIKDVKNLIRDALIASGDAIAYAEPEKLVMSRSGEECVVTSCDQWFLAYGEEQWKATVLAHIDGRGASGKPMEFYAPATQKAFHEALDWLSDWPCSRTFGLGTRLPWDEDVLIDSLSDSTIYMAYYTIAHYLQGADNLDGKKPGPYGIRAEQMTDEVFEYIYRGDASGLANCADPPSRELLDAMRKEFLFWYPMDMRVSAKDLIPNHLSMALYNHAAVWPGEPGVIEGPNSAPMMPRSFFLNGFILVDGEKMSKSKGNFLSMEDALEEFGVDPLRLGLAEAGDGLDDANFRTDTANSHILRLSKELEWIKAVFATRDANELRTGPLNFWDKVMMSSIDRAICSTRKAYGAMMFREGLKFALYELCNDRDTYRSALGVKGNLDGIANLHRDVIMRAIEIQTLLLAPLAPHFCEHIWVDLLKRSGSVVDAAFPEGTIDLPMEFARELLLGGITTWRNEHTKKMKSKNKPKGPLKLRIYVSSEYSSTQQSVLRFASHQFASTGAVSKDREGMIAFAPELKSDMPGAMVFLSWAEKKINTAIADGDTAGAKALLGTQPIVDEKALFEELADYICSSLEISRDSFEVLYAQPVDSLPKDTPKEILERNKTARPYQNQCLWHE